MRRSKCPIEKQLFERVINHFLGSGVV